MCDKMSLRQHASPCSAHLMISSYLLAYATQLELVQEFRHAGPYQCPPLIRPSNWLGLGLAREPRKDWHRAPGACGLACCTSCCSREGNVCWTVYLLWVLLLWFQDCSWGTGMSLGKYLCPCNPVGWNIFCPLDCAHYMGWFDAFPLDWDPSSTEQGFMCQRQNFSIFSEV